MSQTIQTVKANRVHDSLMLVEGTLLAETRTAPRSTGQGPLSITHTLTTGLRPRLDLIWRTESGWYDRGYSLHAFVANSGLQDPYATVTTGHGTRFLRRQADDAQSLPLPSGTHYLTFLLLRDATLNWMEQVGCAVLGQTKPPLAAAVQFAVTVPGAAEAVARVQEETNLMRAMIDHQTVRREMEQVLGLSVDDPVETHRRKTEIELNKREVERQQVETHFLRLIESIRHDVSLSSEQRDEALDRLQNRLDAELRSRNLY